MLQTPHSNVRLAGSASRMSLKIRLQLLLLLIAVSIGAFIIRKQSYRAAQAEAFLQSEINQIAPFPSSKLIKEEKYHKPGSAFVGFTYRADSDFEIVAEFYKQELSRKGWAYHETRGTGSEVLLEFCRGIYAAKLDHVTRAGSESTFTLYLDWGLNNCT
jgi:hypothetical protein